ncbi:hypothetical protein SCP_1603160 [Sparassis crispa]|uniref:Uncharacterized protein n=1 Tax=Sparassis crispa TaxID=139825 RepID=A0A401H5G3_9APHY|nr:hypothetical protein SCP_1603160 [Sparassis crispa]GBE89652.1 hypothetical protein SCP_1603160 [Sparassis crispa]
MKDVRNGIGKGDSDVDVADVDVVMVMVIVMNGYMNDDKTWQAVGTWTWLGTMMVGGH